MKEAWNCSKHFGVHETISAEEIIISTGSCFERTSSYYNYYLKIIIFIIIVVVIYDEMGEKQIPFP